VPFLRALNSALFLAGLPVIYFLQRRLLYRPSNINPFLYDQYADAQLVFETEDGEKIHGWEIKNKAINDTVLIFFGGNSQEILQYLKKEHLRNFSRVYGFNYRGFGLSSGTPSELNIFQDALSICQKVRERNPTAKIHIEGFSLGASVAGYVASEINPESLVLVSPFYSIHAVLNEKLYIPNFLLWDRYELHRFLKSVTVPTLIVSAKCDDVVPHQHGSWLYTELASLKKEVHYINATHNGALEHDEFIELQAIFRGR
jgi:pimeloyl-ACP methyl ester carboxylesterase|tara:strand:- start:1438 stop:2211 length:774 start_codon:yes stop_codon:yes gene_type:complete